jgi:hypothetical protein
MTTVSGAPTSGLARIAALARGNKAAKKAEDDKKDEKDADKGGDDDDAKAEDKEDDDDKASDKNPDEEEKCEEDDDSAAEDDDEEDDDKKKKDSKKAAKAARLSERARIKKILGCKGAQANPDGAFAAAFDTNMSASEAVAILNMMGSSNTAAEEANAGTRETMRQRLEQTPSPTVGSGDASTQQPDLANAIIAAGKKRRGEP